MARKKGGQSRQRVRAAKAKRLRRRTDRRLKKVHGANDAKALRRLPDPIGRRTLDRILDT